MEKTLNSLPDGIIPALITPFHDTGELNEQATRQLVSHLIEQGVHGFYACGSSGEAFLLSPEERMRYLEIVLDETAGRVPVIAHVGTMDTDTSVKLARHAAEAGAVAASAVPPIYYKHGLQQLKQYFVDLAREGGLPVILYHIPDLSGISPAPDFYRELSEVDGIVGIKFTAHNMFEMQQILSSCGPDFKLYHGYDEVLISGLAMGATAGIGSTYNIMPKAYIQLREAFLSGNIATAREIQYKVNEVIRVMAKYNFIAFLREVLRLQGIDTGYARKPLQQLDWKDREEIRDALAKFDFLNVG